MRRGELKERAHEPEHTLSNSKSTSAIQSTVTPPILSRFNSLKLYSIQPSNPSLSANTDSKAPEIQPTLAPDIQAQLHLNAESLVSAILPKTMPTSQEVTPTIPQASTTIQTVTSTPPSPRYTCPQIRTSIQSTIQSRFESKQHEIMHIVKGLRHHLQQKLRSAQVNIKERFETVQCATKQAII